MKPYTALVIDDDIWMQRILSKTLQGFGFTDVLLASNGFEGIAAAVERDPHLIILDILMPELTGHMTLKVLKTIKSTRDIPVLMVSALSDTENLGIAIRSGTAGFISKPFTRATVYEKLINIFGAERLSRIAAGEPFDDTASSFNEDVLQNSAISDEIERLDSFDISPLPEPTEGVSGKSSISPDSLAKRYAEEDKRSLDTIKQLLFKGKK